MKRGAAHALPRPKASTYAGAGVSPEVKDHTARLAVALQALEVPVETVLKALSKTDYAPSRRTLMEHMAAIKDGDRPLSDKKGSGRPPALTDEEWAIVFGWVLRQQKMANLVTVQRWIKANFDMDVSIGSISRHKDAMGLSFQLVGRRGMAPGLSRDEYVIGYSSSSSASIWSSSSTTTLTA